LTNTSPVAGEKAATTAAAPPATAWRRHLGALGVAAAAILLLFATDAAHMATIWWTSSTFNHCLLILPIIGVLDAERAQQLTEQLLTGIRQHRAKVVVIDTTGVPDVDVSVANHLVQTVDASRLMGASVIITGLSSKIAQTLVTIGVDLSKMNTIGDLQGGIEEAERLLGFRVIREEEKSAES